ncbi:MAG: tetratricopeptide repeat protein [Pseudomonadota bacterium]
MGGCKINFTQESNALAYRFYQALSKDGISCADLDVGAGTINYTGTECPAKNDRTCTKGKGDSIVEAEEVFEYALNNYEKYQKLIEGTLSRPLPWVLDDLNPNTPDDFDGKVRGRINEAIAEFKKILEEDGLKEGTPEYSERLAAGLFWLVTSPPKGASNGSVKQKITSGLNGDNLGKFWDYTEKNGGLRIRGDSSEEYTALEALQHKKGKCTETSKILFAVLKMAGFKPIFTYEDIAREKIDDPEIRKLVEGSPPGKFHVCIGLAINGRFRTFDPSLINSDADYKHFYPLSLRQFLSLDYSNRGATWHEKGEGDKAIAELSEAITIDSKCAWAYYNRGLVWGKRDKPDKAIADFSEAIKINPKFAVAHLNLAVACAIMGGKLEIADDKRQALEMYQKALKEAQTAAEFGMPMSDGNLIELRRRIERLR